MEDLLTIEQLKAIAAKGGQLTKAEKRALLLTGEQFGLSVKNTSCKQCWSDFAVEVARMMQAEEAEFYEGLERAPETEIVPRGTKWGVRDGLDVVHLGKRVNAETITDELAEWLLQHRFPEYMLVRKDAACD